MQRKQKKKRKKTGEGMNLGSKGKARYADCTSSCKLRVLGVLFVDIAGLKRHWL